MNEGNLEKKAEGTREGGGDNQESRDAAEAVERITKLAGESQVLYDQITQLTDSQLKEREDLLEKYGKAYESVGEAENQINQLRQIFEADSTNTAIGENLNKAEGILEKLREQTVSIEKRIAVIEKNPKVMEKIAGDAELENKQREAQKIEREFKERVLPETETLGQEIINISFKSQDDWAKNEKSRGELNDLWGKLRDKVNEPRKTSVERSFLGGIEEDIRKVERVDDFLKMLQERRDKLGMFDRTKKKIIDELLAMNDTMESIRTKETENEKNKGNYEADSEEKKRIKERFNDLLEKAWEAEDKINTLLGKERNPKLPSSIYSAVDQKVRGAADIKRWDGKTEVGRHDGWFKATRSDPKIEALYYVWESFIDGADILTRHPKKTKDKE